MGKKKKDDTRELTQSQFIDAIWSIDEKDFLYHLIAECYGRIENLDYVREKKNEEDASSFYS